MDDARGATPARWLRALATLWRDRLLVTLVAVTAATTIGYAVNLGGRSAQVIGAWAFIAAIHLCLTGVGRSIARTPGLTTSARRFWRAVAIAGLIYLAGDLVQVVTAARQPLLETSATGTHLQQAALSLGSAWLGLALLMSPLGLHSRRERARFWLDVATVMVAAVVVGWYLIVPGHPAALLNAAAPVLMGPVILLLCVFVVAKLIMSGTAPFTRWTAALGAIASAVKSGADAIGAGGLNGGRLHWFLAATVAAHALLTIAVRVNQVQLAGDPGALRVRRRPYSLLPYGAVAVTYILLTIAIWRADSMTIPIALGGAAISTALVVVRQLAAFRENARLLGELDGKITELHLTQEGLRQSLAERDSLAARLRHLAFHDGLTGLPNRALYTERLAAALAAGGDVVVMLIDLDDFKVVNDAWGHAAGDELLREIALRLRACVRPDDTVSRLGGDEFAVLLKPVPGDDPREIAARIVAAIEAPVAVDGGSARVGASVGVALSHPGCPHASPDVALDCVMLDGVELDGIALDGIALDGIALDGIALDGIGRQTATRDGATRNGISLDGVAWDGEDLLREADHAMYEVKRAGKGSFAVALSGPEV